ncbi:hypothetical protein GIB67_043206 [Kingdonia uniflora]|uniref:Cytochrome P450 n=1 Tax=Kingdonia uniflora TaxID=39325 RepID=A0A7J7NJI0_9MAGN|nr:hypothetical protein GIB67_043206 [Kingdonia uniflora]
MHIYFKGRPELLGIICYHLKMELPFEFQLPLLGVVLVTLGSLYVAARYLNVNSGKNLPPGSLGFPFFGESIGLLRSMKKNNKEWFESRIRKYGPVFKTSLMGAQFAILTSQAGTKFVLTANDGIANNQSASASAIFGRKSLLDAEGSRHKLLKGAVMNMLKPERLQKFIGEMDIIVKKQLLQELKHKDSVNFVTLIRKVVFMVNCTILFRIPEGGMDKYALRMEDLVAAFRATWAIPLNIPGTVFGKGCKARARICKVLCNLVKTRKKELVEEDEKERDSEYDVITCFLNVRDDEGLPLSEEDIVDNLMTLLLASHDTTASLLSLFVHYIGRDSHVYNKVLEEQKEVARARANSTDVGKLTWSEIQSMKYTWRVAQEIMRLTPPVGGTTRRTTKDISFGGFNIPKGWHLLWMAFSTHMDAEIFEDPEKFDPSRFEKSPSKPVPPPYTYLPFGAGSRICPGSELARVETLLIIHHLIIYYQWTPMITNEPIVNDPVPYPAMGLPAKLHSRADLDKNT